MTAKAPLPRMAPASVRPASLDRAARRSFLADVAIEHGPRDLLARLMLQADTALREQGVFVSFSDCEEIVSINRSNPDSWFRVLPVFDPDYSDLSDDNCVAIVGRNASGKAVFAHASRLYALGTTKLKDEIESLRLFYRDPAAMARPGEAIVCSAKKPASVSGNTVFGGALWIHPEMRGRQLHRASGPLMRCLSYTRWMPEIIFGFMFREVIESGLAARSSLNVEYGLKMVNTLIKPNESPEAAFVWIDRADQLELFTTYGAAISGRDPKVDGVVLDRPADKKIAG